LSLAAVLFVAALPAVEARAIAKDATIYGFPLVDGYRIQHAYFVDHGGPEFKAPWNTLNHTARPSSDTPYSQLGFDLRTEPLVLTMPAVAQGRYYSAQFIDLYTFNFAYVGSRATGNGAGSYLLVGPRWKGEKPKGVASVIRSETELGMVLYRTQLLGPADFAAVSRVQAGYRVQPLSSFLGRPAPKAAAPVEFIKPLGADEERASPEFFNVLSFVLNFCPTQPSEKALMARFAKLDIGAGRRLDLTALSPELLKAIEAGMDDAWHALAEVKRKAELGKIGSGDIYGTREHLKNIYLFRMLAAVNGLYGSSQEEAIDPSYRLDSSGRPTDGSHRYVLRFAPGRFPPVNAFWSLTLYELPSQLLFANKLDRHLVNSHMVPTLKKDADGGVTLYIQHESPGRDRETNWLPAPKGPFFVVLRLYWPKPQALNGSWIKPPLQRID
jgi:hypothetical protein